MKSLFVKVINRPVFVAVICAVFLSGWYGIMKLSRFSENFMYIIMTTLVVIIMMSFSLPEIFRSRGKALVSLTSVFFAAALSASCIPLAINVADGMLQRAAFFAMMFLLFWVFLSGFRVYLIKRAAKKPAVRTDKKFSRYTFFGIFLFSLFGICLLWLNYPNVMSPDSIYQWDELHGVFPYNNIHAIAHTILLKLLCCIYDSFSVAVLLNAVSVAFIYAMFARLLYKKGTSLSALLLMITLSISNDWFARVYIFPWKDTPYTFCLAAITYIMIRLIDSGGKIKLPVAVAAGAFLAFTYLFRLNGVVAAAVCAVVFVWWLIKCRAIKNVISMLLVCAVCIASVNLYSDLVLKTKKLDNGFSIQVFASGVAAVVANDGNITDEQMRRIENILSVEWMKEYSRPWNNRDLIWESDGDEKFKDAEMSVYNNNFVFSLGKNRAEVIKLYLELLPSNLSICVRDVIYNTYAIWSIHDSRFYFSNIFMLALLLFSVMVLWRKKNGDLKYLFVFAPVVFNVISIAISTITNENRYLLATFTLFPVLLSYIVCRARESAADVDAAA